MSEIIRGDLWFYLLAHPEHAETVARHVIHGTPLDFDSGGHVVAEPSPLPAPLVIALGVTLTPSKRSDVYHVITAAEQQTDVNGFPFFALGINGKPPNRALNDRYYTRNGWQVVAS